MREKSGVFRTGWCGITMYHDKKSKTGYTEVTASEASHKRCSGTANGGGDRVLQCACPCHK